MPQMWLWFKNCGKQRHKLYFNFSHFPQFNTISTQIMRCQIWKLKASCVVLFFLHNFRSIICIFLYIRSHRVLETFSSPSPQKCGNCFVKKWRNTVWTEILQYISFQPSKVDCMLEEENKWKRKTNKWKHSMVSIPYVHRQKIFDLTTPV